MAARIARTLPGVLVLAALGWAIWLAARPKPAPTIAPPAEASALGRLTAAPPPTATFPVPTATAAPPAATGHAQLNLFFLAKRSASLEPCGCHTLQRGGVQYEATIYHSYTQLPHLRVDAGGWAVQGIAQAPLEAMKVRYLLRALAALEYEAVNVGWSELELAPEFFRTLGETSPEAVERLVSANLYLKSEPDRPAFARYRIVRRTLPDGKAIAIGLTGVTGGRPAGVRALPGPDGKEPGPFDNPYYSVRPVDEALGPLLDELRPQVDLLVVLFDGPLNASVALARRFQSMDVLVSGGYELGPDTLGYREGNVQLLCVPNDQGKEVGFAPLTRGTDGRWACAAPPRSIYVTLDLDEDPALMQIVRAYRQETKTLEVPPPPDVQRVYAGAESCIACHTAHYWDWAATPHARALTALINKGQEGNPSCLPCHTVGFRHENGFWSVSDINSRRMANVQCESCHGPAYDHATKEAMLKSARFWMAKDELEKLEREALAARPPRQVPESVCIKCHTPDNDLTWSYPDKLPKVDHRGIVATPIPTPRPTDPPAGR